MRQAVRALGWATAVFWILLLLFTITAVYSALQIRPTFGEPSITASGGTLTVSLPFAFFNGGFYDVSKFNITTIVRDTRGSTLTASSTYVPILPKGENTSITHNMSLSIDQFTTSDLSSLLFNDSNLNVTASFKLTYARVFPLEVMANFSVPWGAPLANLTIGDVSVTPFNSTHVQALVPLSFENHSYLNMTGTMRLDIVDNTGRVVGQGATSFNAPTGSRFQENVVVLLSGNPARIREARLYFETPFFSYGPVVIQLV